MSEFFEPLMQAVIGKHVLVFGLGLQGGGLLTANTLAEIGAEVRVSDQKTEEELRESVSRLHPSIQTTFGSQPDSDIEWAEIILKSPAVPYDHPSMQKALSLGKVVTTETAFALQFVRDRAIGITGTRGKTTTTTLIHHVLKQSGVAAHLCGNIPQMPTLAVVAQAQETDWFVIEIPSFHIEAMDRLRVSPRHAVLTNISPDHLNRYPSLEAYASTKAALFRYQQEGDQAYYSDDPQWQSLIEEAIPVVSTRHCITQQRVEESVRTFPHQLPGKHNDRNAAFAIAVARAFGISDENIGSAVSSFRGVPYRQEVVGEHQGIRFINDTTATTPVALETALDSLSEPFILILGGPTKNLPLPNSLLQKLQPIVDRLVWLPGTGSEELAAALRIQPTYQESMESAVQEAIQMAKRYDIHSIILSPGFASFGLFRNEFDRGEQFSALVQKLGKE